MAQRVSTQPGRPPADLGALADAPPSPRGAAAGRRRAGVMVWAAVAWLGLLATLAAGADVLPIAGYTASTDTINLRPGLRWPEFLGTDSVGRSNLSRLVYGARVSLVVGLGGMLIGMLLGGLLGLLAAYFRSWVEWVVDTVSATVLAFPPLVLVLALVAVLAPGLWTLTLCLGLLGIPAFARLVKANALAQVSREYVLAAQAMGATAGRVLFREVLPNTLIPVFSLAAVSVAILIAVEGGLSFLGVGIPPPYPSWGGMIAAGRGQLRTDAHLVLVPCFVIFMTIFSFNTIGDYLRGRFDVRDSKL
jgi:peptide/nickel transport system permease protein